MNARVTFNFYTLLIDAEEMRLFINENKSINAPV